MRDFLPDGWGPTAWRQVVRAGFRSVGLVALLALGSGGCLHGSYKGDAELPANASTTVVLTQVTRERTALNLPAAALVPDLRTIALRGAVAVARGDVSLATAAHTAALNGVQALGRHVWTFATDCADLSQLHLPPLALVSRDLLMNVAAAAGSDGRTFVLFIVAEPGSSSIRADQMGGGAGGNRSIEQYAHPASAPGRCGERWPAAQRNPS